MKTRYLVLSAALLVFSLSPYFGIPAWTPPLATVVALSAVTLVGLNLIFGNAGMLAFGQAAFVALPGYVAGVLLKVYGLPLGVAALIGLFATLLVAYAVGRVFIRLPGIFFAVGTLGFAFVVEGLARAFPSITGGASGLVFTGVTDFSETTWYLIALVTLSIALASYAWLVRHRYARTIATVRHDELAAAVLGIDVARVKLRAFVLGCCYSAIGGLLLALFVGVLVPENAGINRSLEMVGMVMLGGPGSTAGPLLGSLVVNLLFAVAGFGQKYELLIYGAAFLGAVLFARDGLAGLICSRIRLGAPLTSASVPVTPKSGPMPRPVSSGSSLVVQNLAKKYGGVQAITDVSFEVHYGEIFALIGPNGAGKTTLFNIISGLESATSGNVSINRQDVTNAAVHDRASTIGRSFQVARLVTGLTALENVMVRLDQVSPELNEAQGRATALALLSTFGLESIAFTQVAHLSAGQRKLVDIVRAAVGDPPLLLLDEPAVGLTEQELHQLAALLSKLREQRRAIVLIEHNMEFVKQLADRAVVLHGGVLIASGSVRSILNDPEVQGAYLGAVA